MRGCFVFFGGFRWRMTAAFDGIPWYFSCGPYISLDECWSTGEGNQEGSWGGGRGDEHQHLKDKRNNCQRSDGLWGTEAGAGGGRHGLKRRRMRKRGSSSSSMRGDFSPPGVVSWRLSEAEGGTEGGAAASVRLRPRWNDAPARAKKNQNAKQTDDVYALSLGKGRPQHKHSRYHKHFPVSLLRSWQLHGARGASGTTATTLAANPRRKRWRGTSGKTNKRWSLFESTNQTSPFPAFHGAERQREGRRGRPGSLYYTFNEIL